MKGSKFILLLLSLLAIPFVHGQTDKKKILSSFDKIEYYPDSTIKCAYKIKNGLYTGYAIEFDSIGRPSSIGMYKSGKKEGYWQDVDLEGRNYRKGKVKTYLGLPGCGTGRLEAGLEFHNLYAKLTNPG